MIAVTKALTNFLLKTIIELKKLTMNNKTANNKANI